MRTIAVSFKSRTIGRDVSIFIMLSLLIFTAAPVRAEVKNSDFKALEKASPHFDKARTFLDRGRPKDARDEFRKCLEEFPQHAFASYYLASLAYAEGDLDGALKEIGTAVDNADFFGEVLKAAVDLQHQKLVKNMENLETTWYLQENCTLSARALREVEFNEERIEKTVENLARIDARNRRDKAEFVFFRGNLLLGAGKIREGFEDYQQTLVLNPDHGPCYNNLANLFYAGRDSNGALHWVRKADERNIGEAIDPLLRKSIYIALEMSVEGIMETTFPDGVQHFVIQIDRESVTHRNLYENAYVIWDEKTRAALIVDPGRADERIDAFLEEQGLTPCGILNTHGHGDHSGGNGHYSDLFGAPVVAHQGDKDLYSGQPDEVRPDRFLEAEESLEMGPFRIQILSVPGHSPGSVFYLINGALFSGDSLVREGVGNVWADDETERNRILNEMISAIKEKILGLPDDTPVYPGHGKTTSVGWEKEHNPYF